MAQTGFLQTNPLALPRTIDSTVGLTEINSLPAPGNPADLSSVDVPRLTGHVKARKHKITVTPVETITEGEVWTFTFTRTTTQTGQHITSGLPASVDLAVTVGATHTPTGLSASVATAFTAATKITEITGVNSYTRIGEIIGSITASGATFIVEARNSGEVFTVSVSAEAGGSITQVTTTDAAGTDIRIGVALAYAGEVSDDGVTPVVRPLESGDTADDIIGFVADGGTRIKPVAPDTAYTGLYYAPGRDIPLLPKNAGHWTLYSEAACTAFSDVWVRVVAAGAEVAGSLNDAFDEAVQVCTVTPTAAASGVLFHGFVAVYDRDGLPVVSVPFYFAADADNTATETVTGIAADITTPLDGYAVISGTATLIITAVAGYTVEMVSTGAGILASVYTGGTNDHVKLTGAKFSRTTTAGICAVQF
jgi:hypothetical protein